MSFIRHIATVVLGGALTLTALPGVTIAASEDVAIPATLRRAGHQQPW